MGSTKRDYRAVAAKKLARELEAAKDKAFAEPVIQYLIGRCGEDSGLSEDVMQRHKTFGKCMDYLYGKAKKMAGKSQSVAVRDGMVYEWAEDYYHRDDRAEEEKKARERAERKAKQPSGTAKAGSTAVRAKKKERKEKQADGQMDIFSFMGTQTA
ncbi:MAG: PcfK-like family protein [Lachnospiraceae bacterium]|nr:PcfK-like family protein [Lachnospiraceae bacterium]